VDRIEKLFTLHRVLHARRTPAPLGLLKERLGCSRASVYRVADELEQFLGAPIIRERGKGFRYDPDAEAFELPGLWFSSAEIRALLVFQQLLQTLGPGLLDVELEPFRQRIEKLLSGRAAGKGELEKRIRILGMAGRNTGEHFQDCANALVERKRLHIAYLGRSRNHETERDISPQRLTHYRDCWYLDAWCHQRKGLRSFAVERIRSLRQLDETAREIPETDLNAHFAGAYGIFAGPATDIAILRFTSERARWVADEHWHPEQEGKFLEDGSYELRVPYGNSTELIMDILKYGPDVRVVRPLELREQVKQRLAVALEMY
jgi:predicted DNA-binding transcriptional regulator YafY